MSYRRTALITGLLTLTFTVLSWLSTPIASANSSPLLASIFHFSGSRPTTIGVQQGKLATCPSTPNCVSSFSSDEIHKIAALSPTSSLESTFAALKTTLESLPQSNLIKATDTYLYAEFTSKLMGFVDDVEFYLDEEAGVIQVRSASRLGESDLGVNRERIEAIRAALKQTDNAA